MDKTAVYALSPDHTWLNMLEALDLVKMTLKACLCADDYANVDLPRAEANALLLLDAMGQSNIARTVRQLRERGWLSIIVFATVPSEKDARRVYGAGGYDYIAKSYVRAHVESQLAECLRKIEKEKYLEIAEEVLERVEVNEE